MIDRRRPEGIFINPFERGEIGPDLFRAACRIGLKRLVSKRRDRPHQAGRSKQGAIGGNRPGTRFEMELEDPVLGRTLRHAYDIKVLPVVS